MTENIDLVNQTLNDAISTVNKSINDAVSDINTSVDQQIADVNKALTAGDSALKSQLQTVENGLKQSIAQANTGWDKAVKQETADRIADVNAKAAQAADQLLNEKMSGWPALIICRQLFRMATSHWRVRSLKSLPVVGSSLIRSVSGTSIKTMKGGPRTMPVRCRCKSRTKAG